MADVASIISEQEAYVANAIGLVNSQLAGMGQIDLSARLPEQNLVPPPGYSFDNTVQTQNLLQGLFPTDPTIDPISTDGRPTFTPEAISDIPDQQIADFTKEAPAITIPTPPEATLPLAPTAPSIEGISLPEAPGIRLPAVPTIDAIELPEPVLVALPNFDAKAPINDLVVPTNNFTFVEEAYQSDILSALRAKLLGDLNPTFLNGQWSGGYGIDPTDEAGLFDRARSRAMELAASEAESIIAEAAARGFPLPPGDLLVMNQKAQQKLQDTLATANRDLELERANRFVEARKFTIEQARGLEATLINYHNSVMERSLNAAKAVLEVAISLYNAQISGFNARLDAYKTQASVFETRIRAAMVAVEIYRTQIEGKRLQVDVQRAMVEIYNAQLKGVDSVIGLYKSQLEAATVQLGIERLKIETFQGMITAYSEQVRAKVAEFNLFESRIKGEEAKVRAFEAEVRGYTATVDGAKAKLDVLVAHLNAQIAKARNGVEAFNAQSEMYRTIISTQAQVIASNVQIYGSKVAGAGAKVHAVAEAISMDRAEKNLQFQRDAKNADISLEHAKAVLAGLIASLNARVTVNDSAAKVYASIAGAALTTINAYVSQLKQE